MVCAGEYLGACGKLTMAGLAGLHEVLSRGQPWESFDVGDDVAVLGWHQDGWVLWGTHPFERWWGPAWFVDPLR